MIGYQSGKSSNQMMVRILYKSLLKAYTLANQRRILRNTTVKDYFYHSILIHFKPVYLEEK